MKPKKNREVSELLDKFSALEIKMCEAGAEWEKVGGELRKGFKEINNTLEKMPEMVFAEFDRVWAERREKIEKRDLELQMKAFKIRGRKNPPKI